MKVEEVDVHEHDILMELLHYDWQSYGDLWSEHVSLVTQDISPPSPIRPI